LADRQEGAIQGKLFLDRIMAEIEKVGELGFAGIPPPGGGGDDDPAPGIGFQDIPDFQELVLIGNAGTAELADYTRHFTPTNTINQP